MNKSDIVQRVLERERALGLEFVPAVDDERVARARRNIEANQPERPVAREQLESEQIEREETSMAGAEPTSTEQPRDGRPVVEDLSDLLSEPAVAEAGSLDALTQVIDGCERCKLSGGRTHIVFGVGNPNAELMFVGEGPGQDEDQQGIPFVGRAGKLLTDIITKGMGLDREEVYIANVVKCRPPGNRNPEPDEIVACEPFLHKQIALIRPKVMVTLGTFATQVLLKNRTPISRQRGEWHQYKGVPVMPTFHPAYLLRNGGDKRLVWDDIKMVMERLDIPLPEERSN